jgi:hypothetical protein
MDGVVELSYHCPDNVHGGDASLEIVIVGQVQYLVYQVFGDV